MSNFFGAPITHDENEHILAQTSGNYSDTMMNVTIYHIRESETRKFIFPKEEAAFLLIEGDVAFEWNGQSTTASRKSCFTDPPICLQASHNTEVTVVGLTNSELLVQSTENPKHFFSVLHSGKTVRTIMEDTDKAAGKGQYLRRTVFDYDTAPHSNLVLTEIILPQGGWDGATPHLHPQPEVNYYRFDKPHGYGFYSVEDEVFRITDRCYSTVEGNKPHTRVTAPGYPLYIASMIRHFPGAPWRERNIQEEHSWITA